MEPGPSGLPVARKSIRSHENLNVYGGEGKEPEVSQASGDGRAVEHERSDSTWSLPYFHCEYPQRMSKSMIALQIMRFTADMVVIRKTELCQQTT
jgi:hypothetical protein